MIFDSNLTQLNLTDDLRSYYTEPLRRVSVLGGVTINDNLGGDFFWSSTSLLTDDGINIFQVTGLTVGRWIRIATAKQSLSLGTTPGNIVLSGGGNVSLNSLNMAAVSSFPDASIIPADAGTYVGSTSSVAPNISVGYPTARGTFVKFVRTGGSAIGFFELYKSDAGDRNLFFRTGITANTFTDWIIIGGGRGTTVQRPTVSTQGVQYFDTTLGKPIWWKGSVWVDAT